MLYKYTKDPISIKKTPPRHIKIRHSKAQDNTILMFFIIIASITMLSIYLYPYLTSNTKIGESAEKFIVNSYSNILGESTITLLNINQSYHDYLNNANKTIAFTNKEIKQANKLHPELANISGDMYLSIKKLGFKDIPVQINVDSTDEKHYMPILVKKLAHFKGTSLPGYGGNIFIYGHSANEFLSRLNPRQPIVAFTYLNNLDIGDEITLKYQDKVYRYKVIRSKMVVPEDLSSIYSKDNENTLTLMTCWPPGIGTDRLIVVAEQI